MHCEFSFEHNGSQIDVEASVWEEPFQGVSQVLRLSGKRLIWLAFDGEKWKPWENWTDKQFQRFKDADPRAFEVAVEMVERRMKLASFE